MSEHPLRDGLVVGWFLGRRSARKHDDGPAPDPDVLLSHRDLAGERRSMRKAGLAAPTAADEMHQLRTNLGVGDDPDDYDDDPDREPDGGPVRVAVAERPQPVPAMPERDPLPDTAAREHRPLLPPALQDPRRYAELAVRRAAFVTLFHLVRIPQYLWNNLCWSPKGFYRLSAGLARWARVHDAREMEASAAQVAQSTREPAAHATWMRMKANRVEQAKRRLGAAVFIVLAVAGVLAYGLTRGPLGVVVTALAAVLVLGWFGQPADRPYIESAVVSAPGARVYSAEIVAKALQDTGLCKSIEPGDPGAPYFPPPGLGRSHNNKGWEVIVDLPGAVTAEKAMGRRQQLAGALRLDEAQLYLDPVRGDAGHASRLRMYICDSDPHGGPAVESPLNTTPQFDFWQPIPFGIDERGETVAIPLVWCAMLIGALPRIGKTFALRLIIAAAALDPYVRLLLWDGKGGADHMDWSKVCHGFGVGSDDDVAGSLLDHLNAQILDMKRRYATLRDLPRKVCPDGKLTKALSHDPRLNMPLTVVAIDEFQEYLGSKRYGAQILEALTTLAKLGPAAGIMLVLATQRPSAETIPTELRDVIGVRFAMRVMGWQFSEMVLGSGTRSALGLDASRFTKDQLGVGILLGTGDAALAARGAATIRTHLMDLVAMEIVAERALGLREDKGTLTGVAAGEDEVALSDRVLEHVLAAFQGEDKAHSEVLVDRMQRRWPELYETWTQTDLAAALGRFGLSGGVQVWAEFLVPVDGKDKGNRKGFLYQAVFDALEERERLAAERLHGPVEVP